MSEVDRPLQKLPKIVVGQFAPVPRDRRAQGRRVLAVIAAVFLAACVVGGWKLYQFMHPPQSALEKQAVIDSRRAAAGFEDKSKEYTLKQLSQAVTYAYAGNCDKARAAAADAATHRNSIDDSYFKRINERIDDICSGPTAASSGSEAH